jgi:hypothetical protein
MESEYSNMTKEQEYIGVDMKTETTTSKVDYKGFGFAYIYMARILFIIIAIGIFLGIGFGFTAINSSWGAVGFSVGLPCAIISYLVNNFFISAYKNLAIIAKTNVDIVKKLEELNKTKELNQ